MGKDFRTKFHHRGLINISVDIFLGYVTWANKPAAENAVLANVLEACGAVLYVKTNVPQTLMV